MAKLVRVFISESRRRALHIALWVALFVVILGAMALLGVNRVGGALHDEGLAGVKQFRQIRANVGTAFAALRRQVTAEPCSAAFRSQLRRVAYLPDGLNEFLYAPNGQVQCSVSLGRLDKPVNLGNPDVAAREPGTAALWVDHPLDFLGLDGFVGVIALRDPFAIVVPLQHLSTEGGLIRQQAVLVGSDGRWWHRGGEPGVYQREQAAESSWLPFRRGTMHDLVCTPGGMYCIASEVSLSSLIASGPALIVVSVLFAVLLATWLADHANGLIARYWSLEARFRRHLSVETVICAYQPIVHLQTDEIRGCEVLARWRDVDDTTIYPDAFIGIVERCNLTRVFTRLVAERAFAELSVYLPADRRLQVNFNISPRDLDCDVLRQIFAVFERARGRFDVVVEIVESDAIVVETAQQEIEALRRAGIRTYIDDFGAGYSNIHNIAALSVDGVKLDRAFAMAPDDSLMARMLGYAVDMVQESGRTIVVEGVETEERLQQLRNAGKQIDYVQGYHLSRPLDIQRFARLIRFQQERGALKRQAA